MNQYKNLILTYYYSLRLKINDLNLTLCAIHIIYFTLIFLLICTCKY
jgi:hypothetical protein